MKKNYKRMAGKLQRGKILWKAEHNQYGARLESGGQSHKAGKMKVASALVATGRTDSQKRKGLGCRREEC